MVRLRNSSRYVAARWHRAALVAALLASTAALSCAGVDDGPDDLETAQRDLQHAHDTAIRTACECYLPAGESCEEEEVAVSQCVWSAYERHRTEAIELLRCRAWAVRSYSVCLFDCPESLDTCYPYLSESSSYCDQRLTVGFKEALEECSY